MARVPVMAAGGIVMRREQPPLIAVVRLRKRDEWVLPKGKLDDGETPRAAARREVLEETGHNVTVHEFLGTLVYESGGRSKVVHYWRMEAGGTQTRELMSDIRAVDWLPLDAAIARLSRAYERTFLENVGPLAVNVLSRRLKAAKAPPAVKAAPAIKAPAKKRRVRPPVEAPGLPPAALVLEAPMQGELAPEPVVADELMAGSSLDAASEPASLPIEEPALVDEPTLVEEEFIPQPDVAEGEAPAAEASAVVPQEGDATPDPAGRERPSLAQKVRNWLGRAA
jgi:8-oxo-dGTP diphosphatase